MRLDAVVRNFEIIGEAANRLSQEIHKKYPNVEWRRIIGFRNRVVHEYFGIDFEILWSIIENNLADLKRLKRKRTLLFVTLAKNKFI